MNKHIKALEKLSLSKATVARVTSGVNASIALGTIHQPMSEYHLAILQDNLDTTEEVYSKIYSF